MTVIDAVILGIVQGLTEFLPISSSGHLVLGQEILGVSVPGNTFEVVVHLGTLGSVLIAFWSDILNIFKTIAHKATQKYIFAIIIGTVPAVIIGFLFNDIIEKAFESVKLVAVTLFITGIILLSTRFIKNKNKDVSIKRGLLVGISQALAIIPGISRSGITISTGMHLGIAPEKAATYSFLLAIPAIFGAGLLKTIDMISTGSNSFPISIMLTGFFSSLIVGWISLKVLIGLIKTGKFYWFGFYCLTVAILAWGI